MYSIRLHLLSPVTDEGDCRVTITLKFDALLARAYQVNMTNLPSHTKAFINACTQVKKWKCSVQLTRSERTFFRAASKTRLCLASDLTIRRAWYCREMSDNEYTEPNLSYYICIKDSPSQLVKVPSCTDSTSLSPLLISHQKLHQFVSLLRGLPLDSNRYALAAFLWWTCLLK